MSDTVNIGRVVKIIQALMQKTTDNGCTEEEMALAAEKVQSLLEQYNLSLDAIASSKTDSRGKDMHQAAAMYKYQRRLMKAVAEMNFCMHWLDEITAESFGKTRKVKRHVLLGRKVNIVGTTMMYDYLVATLDRMLPYQGMAKRGKSALLWREGASDRLQVRLADARYEREAEAAKKTEEEAVRARHPGAASTGTSLTIVDLTKNEYDLNVDALEGLEPGTTTARRLAREARQAVLNAEWEEEKKIVDAKTADLMAGGMSYDEAWHRARGHHWTPPKEPTPETEAQKRKREDRERRDNEKFWDKYYKENARKNTPEYAAGSAAGGDISLNRQVGKDKLGAQP